MTLQRSDHELHVTNTEVGSLRRRRLSLLFILLVVNLHLFRDVAPVPYYAIYAIAAGMSIMGLVGDSGLRARLNLGPIGIWMLAISIGFAVTCCTIGIDGAITGFIRASFALPVFFALASFIRSEEDLRFAIRILVGFVAVAMLTIPLQTLIGPIPWFAEASSRGGYARFGSLLGSLTIAGQVAGPYLVLNGLSRPLLRTIFAVAIAVSALTSLSKAGVANVVIATLIILLIGRKRLLIVIGGTLVTALCAWTLMRQPELLERMAPVVGSFSADAGTGAYVNDDVSASQSLTDRLTVLPGQNLAALADIHSPLVYIVGGGYGMASTVLVPQGDSAAPMAHNQYVEMFSVFGFLGLALMGLLIWIAIRLIKLYRATGQVIVLTIFAAYVVLLVNGIAANGLIFHPTSASILFLAIFAASSKLWQTDILIKSSPAPAQPKS